MNKIINRDIIKYVAMLTMLLNHLAGIFLVPGTFLYEILDSIGYFTGTVMIYFLVEGYYHTRSRKKYFGRLLFFALISQIPFSFAFTENGGRLNMIFSLCICYFLIRGLDKCPGSGEKILVFVIAFIMSFFCDWPLLAPIFTLTFFLGMGNKKKLQLAFGLNIICFWIFEFLDKKDIMSLNEAMLYSFLGIVGVGIAALCILCFYNGKRADHGKNFSKWFFYIFYPTHLLILGIVERLIEIN